MQHCLSNWLCMAGSDHLLIHGRVSSPSAAKQRDLTAFLSTWIFAV